MSTEEEEAVRRALELAPHSIRALADEAGVSESLLRHTRDGIRPATSRTLTALADALDRLSEKSGQAARILRDSLQEGDHS